jgi:hypothetical protein
MGRILTETSSPPPLTHEYFDPLPESDTFPGKKLQETMCQISVLRLKTYRQTVPLSTDLLVLLDADALIYRSIG